MGSVQPEVLTQTHRFGPKHGTMGLTSDPNFQNLEKWYKSNAAKLNMRQMFEADKTRFQKFRYFIDLSNYSARSGSLV